MVQYSNLSWSSSCQPANQPTSQHCAFKKKKGRRAHHTPHKIEFIHHRRYYYLHLLIHRCLPFSPLMCIFRRCWSSRPSTVSGRCVARNWLLRYVQTLIGEKNSIKRGLVYPKLAQSKGSGDRMHSPDLFWGTRRVSAAPPGPDPREAVPRGRSVHLPKVL